MVQYNRLKSVYGTAMRAHLGPGHGKEADKNFDSDPSVWTMTEEQGSGGRFDRNPASGKETLSKGHHGSVVANLLNHDPPDADVHVAHAAKGGQVAEAGFMAALGRKKRVSAVPRAHSTDPVWEAAAGRRQKFGVNLDFHGRSRLFHARPDDTTGNIVPALTAGDKNIVDNSHGIANGNEKWDRKGQGSFSHGFSELTHRLSVANHATVLRYEAEDPILRSSSVPPDSRRSKWNPVTHEGDAQAGFVVAPWQNGGGNHGGDGGLDSTPFAGIPNARLSEKKYKQWKGGSPRTLDPGAWNSHTMSQVTGNTGLHEAAAERQHRLATDTAFRNVCAATEELKQELVSKAGQIRSKHGSQFSHQVASTLQWNT
jgi:hypothetical protein